MSTVSQPLGVPGVIRLGRFPGDVSLVSALLEGELEFG